MNETQWVTAFSTRLNALRGADAEPLSVLLFATQMYPVLRDHGPFAAAQAEFARHPLVPVAETANDD